MSPGRVHRRFISGPRKLLGLLVLVVAGYVFSLFMLGKVMTFQIEGASMAPALLEGDHVFVDLTLDEPLAHGDIVIFPDPREFIEDDILVKRVIGLPGDRIEVRHHRILVNGVPERLPGQSDPRVMDLDDDEFTLGEGQLYLLGDNRPVSLDSTELQAIRIESVIGRVTFCYWPMARFGHVN
ncbi:signal peptidase I [Candidatus Sumerlaeota bacterium]|nr:signal peptidase I [Candidatus Sumerlaeota bacterium]